MTSVASEGFNLDEALPSAILSDQIQIVETIQFLHLLTSQGLHWFNGVGELNARRVVSGLEDIKMGPTLITEAGAKDIPIKTRQTSQ